jgi:hypothetical protein
MEWTMSDLFGTPSTIKAISLWQPWASLMACGVKRHETRHWSTAYRGPIAIHASKTVDIAGAPDKLCLDALGPYWSKTVPQGAVVAIGTLAAVTAAERAADHLTAADLAAGNFTPGRFAWRVEMVRRLQAPIPTIGRQGLFNWTPPDDLEKRLGPPIDHGAAVRIIGWAA